MNPANQVASGVIGCQHHAEIAALRAEVERLRGELEKEEKDHTCTIYERDAAQEAADKLAYTIGDESEIGEHSSGNDPWENAADLLVEKLAEAERLQSRCARWRVVAGRIWERRAEAAMMAGLYRSAMRDAVAEAARQHAEVDRLTRDYESLIAIAQGFQPGGSPPPGGPDVLVHWILRSMLTARVNAERDAALARQDVADLQARGAAYFADNDRLRQSNAALVAALEQSPCKCQRAARCQECGNDLVEGRDQYAGSWICGVCVKERDLLELPVIRKCSRCAALDAARKERP